MRPRRNLAALFSGVLLLACLSACASVPRVESSRKSRSSFGVTGPTLPQALRAEPYRDGFVAYVVPVLKTTGNVLLDIATAVLPEPDSKVGIWTHGYDYSDSLTGFDRDGDEGMTGCIANSAVQWCPFVLAP